MAVETVGNFSSNFINGLTILFYLIHMIFHCERLLHLFCRFWFPKKTHPEMKDVILPTTQDDEYPLVAIQLPMMNETECCQSAIDYACNLNWPKTRLIVQVLDDSTEEKAKMVIDTCVKQWTTRGIQIQLHRRDDRRGFKAGNLKYGMEFIKEVDYIAIFDVDFLPSADFLHKTVPSLMLDPKVAFVQARWAFTNAKESLLTRMQEIHLNYHHRCEQEGRYRASMFFTFNGSGAIWRRSAIEDVGGWHADTLVEDLDLALRSYAFGWHAVFLDEFPCLNELPPTQFAFMAQQYRWYCGYMQVGRKLFQIVFQSRYIPWYQKLSCAWYFLRTWAYLVSFSLLIFVIPLTVWEFMSISHLVISLVSTTLLTFPWIIFTLDELHLFIPYAFFMNAMALQNSSGIIAGLLNTEQSRQWIVTPKFGLHTSETRTSELMPVNGMIDQSHSYWLFRPIRLIHYYSRRFFKFINKKFQSKQLYTSYIVVGLYLLFVSLFAVQKAAYIVGLHVMLTAIPCLILGFSLMGRQH